MSISMGGTLSPGNSIGTLTVTGNVTFNSGSHLLAEVSGSSSDLLAVTGNLDLSAANDFLDVLALGGNVGASPYAIATYSGSLTGTFDNVTPGFQVAYGNHQITVTAIPEPTQVSLAAAGVALLIRRRRRQHRKQR